MPTAGQIIVPGRPAGKAPPLLSTGSSNTLHWILQYKDLVWGALFTSCGIRWIKLIFLIIYLEIEKVDGCKAGYCIT